jgi:shikimate kinase
MERRCWDQSQVIALIGPGGAGKLSLAVRLAPLLRLSFADLDSEFGRRFGDIGAYIRREVHYAYKLRNAALARQIIAGPFGPKLLVMSSGFLAQDNPPGALEANRRLIAACYSICLLPSRNMEESVAVIVERQSHRRFGRGPAREEAVIRERYPIYAREGDLLVFSTASPDDTAEAITLQLSTRLSGR